MIDPAFTVSGLSGSSNVTVTFEFVGTPDESAAGVVALTRGARVSAGGSRLNTASTQ